MVLRRQLATFLTQRGHRTTFVIDGIDEAEDPSIIIADQIGPLLRLTDDHGRRLVRLIVGLRRRLGQGPSTVCSTCFTEQLIHSMYSNCGRTARMPPPTSLPMSKLCSRDAMALTSSSHLHAKRQHPLSPMPLRLVLGRSPRWRAAA